VALNAGLNVPYGGSRFSSDVLVVDRCFLGHSVQLANLSKALRLFYLEQLQSG